MDVLITRPSHKADERQLRKCQCSACGIIALCTPAFDFYAEPGELLVCENCFRKELEDQGMRLVNFDPSDFSPMTHWLENLIEDCIRSLDSPHTRAAYRREITAFLAWLNGNPVSSSLLLMYREEQRELRSDSSVNIGLSAIRKLVALAAQRKMIGLQLAEEISRVPNIKCGNGQKSGNWLTKQEAEKLLHAPPDTLKGRRDRTILGLLIGCGLRRNEARFLRFEDISQREGRWAIIDLVGKGNKSRTIPMPAWCKAIIDKWSERAKIDAGFVIRRCGHGRMGEIVFDQALTDVGIWRAIELYSRRAIGRTIGPHDLRRTYAKLARQGGAHLEQIQITLGHVSLATTEKYLGCEIDFQHAPGDMLGLEVEV